MKPEYTIERERSRITGVYEWVIRKDGVRIATVRSEAAAERFVAREKSAP